MILKPVNSMKLKHQKPSTPPQISERTEKAAAYFYEGAGWAVAPTPPTMAAIKRAQFVDKTYVWRGR